jgi:hypothetical protein
MLVFFMIISYQACLVCKIISKSCPHDQFVLNYSLSTKLYISTISGFQFVSEICILTEQVWPTLASLVRGFTRQVWSLHRTSLVPRVFKSLDCFPDRIWSLFHFDWYRSIYLHKKTPMVKTKVVN